VIPARNAEQTLQRAIDSALSQSYPNIEIVVIDDCSTDKTAEVLDRYSGARVKIIRSDRCFGVSAARNAAIDAANGTLIAFLDADDEWLPHKIEKQVAHYRAGSNYALIASASNEFAPDGTDIGDTCGNRRMATGTDAWKALLADTFFHTSTVMTPRAAIQAIGGFDTRLKLGEDQDAWIRLALMGQVGYIPESLARIHVLPGSLSRSDSAQELVYTLPMIREHLTKLGDKLGRREKNLIMAQRMARLGRSMCGEGDYRRGSRLILSSLRHGYDPWPSIVCLLQASPPARSLKNWVRQLVR
jgi:glycosyltransferase involved in cell wall biosynthesis